MKTQYINGAVFNITSITFFNIARYVNTTVSSTQYPHRSGIGFGLISTPKFIFHKVGNDFVAYDEKTGFACAYTHKPKSSGGFANREITLKVYGGKVFKNKGVSKITFKGDLWGTSSAYETAEEFFGIKLEPVSYMQQYARIRVYTFGYINKEVLDAKMLMAGIRFLSEEENERFVKDITD